MGIKLAKGDICQVDFMSLIVIINRIMGNRMIHMAPRRLRK